MSVVMSECEECEDPTLQTILHIRNQFYETNTKRAIFKKNEQKFECGETIQQHISFESLASKTFWIVPNTNKVYFDYTVFKMYVVPSNYSFIVDQVLQLCTQCANRFRSFEVHVNIDTFTVSAANRYKDIITLFSQECMMRETRFIECLESMHIYNTPNMIDHISAILTPLLPIEVRGKIKLYNKKISGQMIHKNMNREERI
jgi:hypothetical protein